MGGNTGKDWEMEAGKAVEGTYGVVSLSTVYIGGAINQSNQFCSVPFRV